MRPKHWSKDDDEKLRYYWSACYLKELAQIIGCSKNTIRDHAAKLGLTLADKSDCYKDKRTETNRQAAIKFHKRPMPYSVGHKHTDEAKQKIADKRRALYASERRRVLFGLPQRTNIKVRV